MCAAHIALCATAGFLQAVYVCLLLSPLPLLHFFITHLFLWTYLLFIHIISGCCYNQISPCGTIKVLFYSILFFFFLLSDNNWQWNVDVNEVAALHRSNLDFWKFNADWQNLHWHNFKNKDCAENLSVFTSYQVVSLHTVLWGV